MIPFTELVPRYNISITGLIHVGSHEASEIKEYSTLGLTDVVLVEANPTRFQNVLESLSTGRYCTWCSPLTYEYFNDHRTDIVKQYKAFNYAISDRTGSLSFNISNYDGGTDSIFKINEIGQQTSWVPYEHVSSVEVPTTTLDILIEDKATYNFLNIDVEGAELLVLRGAEEVLKGIDWILVETQDVIRFDNSSSRSEVMSLLESAGFELVTYFDTGKGWGDCLFKKKLRS
jgi:FkbM family methyltransferase